MKGFLPLTLAAFVRMQVSEDGTSPTKEDLDLLQVVGTGLSPKVQAAPVVRQEATVEAVPHVVNVAPQVPVVRASGLGLEIEFDFMVDDGEAFDFDFDAGPRPGALPRQTRWLQTKGSSAIAAAFPWVSLERDGSAPEIVTGPVNGQDAAAVTGLVHLGQELMRGVYRAHEALAAEGRTTTIAGLVPVLAAVEKAGLLGHLPSAVYTPVAAATDLELVEGPKFDAGDWSEVKLLRSTKGSNLQTSVEVGCDRVGDVSAFGKLFVRASKNWGYTLYKFAASFYDATIPDGDDARLKGWFVTAVWSRVMKAFFDAGEFELFSLGGPSNAHAEYKNEFQLMPRTDSFALYDLVRTREPANTDRLLHAVLAWKEADISDAYEAAVRGNRFLRLRVGRRGAEITKRVVTALLSFQADLAKAATQASDSAEWVRMQTFRDGHNMANVAPRCEGDQCFCLFEGRGPSYDSLSKVLAPYFDANKVEYGSAKDSDAGAAGARIAAMLAKVQPQGP